VSSLRSLESHVIPAKAGIQFVEAWTPACAGVTKPAAFTSMGGPQAYGHSDQALPALPERHDFPKTPILLVFINFRDRMRDECIVLPFGLTSTHAFGWTRL
jgi:hypothetical protein